MIDEEDEKSESFNQEVSEKYELRDSNLNRNEEFKIADVRKIIKYEEIQF